MPLIRPLHSGNVVGSFEISECLTEGAIASTWRAKDLSSGALIALKTIPLASLEDPDAEDQILEHAALAREFNRPGVARLVKFGRDAGFLFLAYEWVNGGDLASLLKQTEEHGPIPQGIALRIAFELCGTLAAIHNTGLIHQVISPSNVLISGDGSPKLLGLGVGMLHRTSSATTFRHMVGKFSYLSPEQLWSRPVEKSSDIFSLGLIFFELLTGQHPFRGKTERETTAKILAPTEAQIPEDLRASLPPALVECLRRALLKDPAQRFTSAEEMMGFLNRALGGEQMLASFSDVRDLHQAWCAPEISATAPPAASEAPLSAAFTSGNATLQLPAMRVKPSYSSSWLLLLLATLLLAGGTFWMLSRS